MGSQPEETPESSDLLEDSPADPLARLGHTLDTLRRDAEGLAHEIDAETGPASEMRLALARCFSDVTVKAVIVDPLSSNTGACRFYERLGFRRVERRRFGEDDCRVYRLDRDGAKLPAR